MASSQKSLDGASLDGLLLVGSEALWGGVQGTSSGEEGERREVEKTVEFESLSERAIAVESCLFVVQVLKAAQRRTIGANMRRSSTDVFGSSLCRNFKKFQYSTDTSWIVTN